MIVMLSQVCPEDHFATTGTLVLTCDYHMLTHLLRPRDRDTETGPEGVSYSRRLRDRVYLLALRTMVTLSW